MKLFYSPFHTFIHKVLVTVHEAGLWQDITFVPTYPFKNREGEDQGDAYSIAALNPLDKVPTTRFSAPIRCPTLGAVEGSTIPVCPRLISKNND